MIVPVTTFHTAYCSYDLMSLWPMQCAMRPRSAGGVRLCNLPVMFDGITALNPHV